MIVLISRITDETTVKIIEWLKYSKKEFIRINTIQEIMNNFYFDSDLNYFQFEYENIVI